MIRFKIGDQDFSAMSFTFETIDALHELAGRFGVPEDKVLELAAECKRILDAQPADPAS